MKNLQNVQIIGLDGILESSLLPCFLPRLGRSKLGAACRKVNNTTCVFNIFQFDQGSSQQRHEEIFLLDALNGFSQHSTAQGDATRAT